MAKFAIGTENEYNLVSWVISKLREISDGQRLLDHKTLKIIISGSTGQRMVFS